MKPLPESLPARRPRALRALAGLLLLWSGGLPSAHALQCPPVRLANEALPPLEFEHGLLFRITSVGGTSYLFGTIHVSDPIEPRIPAPAIEALQDSRHFAMEVLLDFAAMQTLASDMFYRDGRALAQVVGADLAQAAVELLARHEIPPALAGSMKPWAAFMTLSMPAGPQTVPLDLLLMQRAATAGLQLHGLETLAEQTSIFTDLPLADQRALLAQSVCQYDLAQRELAELMVRYEARDLRGLLEIATRYASEPRELQAALLDTLLWARNDRMLERMLPLVEEGGAFIAVGALHLPGPRGLLEQLTSRGYLVEPIY